MTVSESWLRLDAMYCGSEGDKRVAEVAGRHGMAAMAYWPALLATAKRARNFGQVEIHIASFALICHDYPAGPDWYESRAELWRDLARARLVELDREPEEIDPFESFVVRVSKWSDWQSMSAAERSKLHREKHRSSEPTSRSGETNGSSRVTENRSSVHLPTTYDKQGSSNPLSETSLPDPPGVPVSKSKNPKVGKLSDAEIEAGIAECRSVLNGCGDLVDQLVLVLAAENKSGKVSLSRTLSFLWRPLAEAMQAEGLSSAQMQYGLQQALAASDGQGAPNPRYVLKSARKFTGHRAAPSVHLQSPTPDGANVGEYDAIDWLTND